MEQNESNLLRINVAIRPSQKIEAEIINLANRISLRKKVSFKVDGVNFYPHITLYSPAFPIKNANKVLETVARILAKFSDFSEELSEFQSDWGYIGFKVNLSREIKLLHEALVLGLNHLREGCLREKYKDEEALKNFSQKQRENIRLYGYPDVMDLFAPHLNLVKFVDEKEAQRIVKKLTWPAENFLVKRIAAFKMGAHGTCVEIIKDFFLK